MKLMELKIKKNVLVQSIEYFNFATNQFYAKKENKKTLKKNRITHINKNPIICICNSVDKNLSGIMKEVIHIRFQSPNDVDIFKLLKKINDAEKLGINDMILQLIVPHCQSDFRRTVCLEHIRIYTAWRKNRCG